MIAWIVWRCPKAWTGELGSLGSLGSLGPHALLDALGGGHAEWNMRAAVGDPVTTLTVQ